MHSDKFTRFGGFRNEENGEVCLFYFSKKQQRQQLLAKGVYTSQILYTMFKVAPGSIRVDHRRQKF